MGIVQSLVRGSWSSWCSGLWAQDYQICFLSHSSFHKKKLHTSFTSFGVIYEPIWSHYQAVDETALNSEALEVVTNWYQYMRSQHHYKISDTYIDSAVTLCMHSRWVCRMLHQLYSVSQVNSRHCKRICDYYFVCFHYVCLRNGGWNMLALSV